MCIIGSAASPITTGEILSSAIHMLNLSVALSLDKNGSLYSGNNSKPVDLYRAVALARYSLAFVVIISILIAFVSIVTVLGNLMVMLSFYIDRNVRTPSNYFILSLAVSDFIIGLEGKKSLEFNLRSIHTYMQSVTISLRD